MPVLKSKWPSYAKTLARFSQLATEQVLLLDEVASEDLAKLTSNKHQTINIEALLLLSKQRQKNCLHYWGKTYANLAPSSNEINELIKQLPSCVGRAIAVNFSGRLVRSFSGELLLTPKQQPLPIEKKIQWENLSNELLLPNETRFVAHFSKGRGMRLLENNEKIWIDKRRGGEKCLADYRNKSAELKKIYQDLKVPVWEREWLPVIYIDDEIAAVPGVFVVKKFMPQPEQESINITIETLSG